ncbi:GNAT family N-acetyltransferase [Taibaiella koreensis]|uniref:GNAT family N-acetyltransferase n=1 Tax=Taibaiella koreensis TaxID=1268548 RepID=UPI000E59D445|nr:GNAT family N-acetyltransferase [Taibaiella koreensis]
MTANNQDKIIIRALGLQEIDRIQEIDRSEEITESYRLLNGSLQLMATPESVSGFEQEELEGIIKRQKELLHRGGSVLGAFDGATLAGVASVERKIIAPAWCKMDILYVSRAYRKQQLGVRLLLACKELAGSYGAGGLYISATPTRGTVDFYLRQGGRILDTPDPELLRMEPDDIHIVLAL